MGILHYKIGSNHKPITFRDLPCDECVSAFLRGFFDSEGSVKQAGELWAYNNKTDHLRYVMKLLRDYFGVQTTGPHLGKGEEVGLYGEDEVIFGISIPVESTSKANISRGSL
jgi:hypothetical protein